MDQTLLKKQEYLSKQILEDGYDPEEFQDYMFEHSNKQLDLNFWTLPELHSIVTQFKTKRANASKLQQEEEGEEGEGMQAHDIDQKGEQQRPMTVIKEQLEEQNMEEQENEQQADSHSVNTSLYKYYTIEKKTNLPDLYIMAHEKKKPPKITIGHYIKTNPHNIFQASYIRYEIECSLGWKTMRRFNDFMWLIKYLNRTYQGFPIPPIPAKTATRSFDEKHIEQRMKVFQKFLNEIVKIPELCSDPLVEVFLRADAEGFSAAKSSSEKGKDKQRKGKKKRVIESIYGQDLLLEGLAGIEKQKADEYSQMMRKYQILCGKLAHFDESLKKVAAESEEISITFQELKSVMRSQKGLGILDVMDSFFHKFAQHLLSSIGHMENTLWKYQSLKVSTLNTYITELNKEQKEIGRRHKGAMMAMTEEDEDGYLDNSPSKKLREFQRGKERYRIRLAYLAREIDRYESANFRDICTVWTQKLKGYIGDISNWMIDCTDELTRSMSLAEGKQLMEVDYRT